MLNKLSMFAIICTCLVLLAGCATSGTPIIVTSIPTSVPPTAKIAPSATPIPPTETPTPVPPTPTATTPPVNIIEKYPSGQEFTVTSLDMVDALNGWAIGGLGGKVGDHVLFTTDGGNTWKDVTPPEPAPAADQTKVAFGYFQGANNAWVTYSINGGNPVPASPVVWRTSDGGTTWTASQSLDVSGLSEIYVPGSLWFYGQQAGWLLAHVGVGMNHDYVVIYRTNDGGATWSRILDPYNDGGIQSCSKNAMIFTSPTQGWLTGDCNGVKAGVLFYMSTDAGSTWQEVSLPTPPGMPDLFGQNNACGSYDLRFFGGDLGVMQVRCANFGAAAVTYSYYIYTTQDGGSTWSGANAPGDALYFFTMSTGWAIAPKIQQTTDGGKTWKPIADVSWIGQFDFISETVGWAVATAGDNVALVKTGNGGAHWSLLVPTVK